MELCFKNIDKLPFHEQYKVFNSEVNHNNYLSIPRKERILFSKANQELDKYYTKQSVADDCYKALKEIINISNVDNDIIFIEPSAGSGVFLNSIKDNKLGFDIAPTKESKHKICQNDFLNQDLFELLSDSQKSKQIVFIGNPPFGKKSKLAIDFINKSLSYSNIVGFIVPIQFKKWSVQSKINNKAKLVLDLDLQEDAFEFMGKDYKVRCCFQVWILDSFKTHLTDLRIKSKPEINHPDFEMYQYNRTEQAKKFFNYEWDFAVPRQGYLDYTFKAYKKSDCDIKKQWIFFKAKDPLILQNLKDLNFVELSRKNIGIPGFGKADVIQEYIRKYGK